MNAIIGTALFTQYYYWFPMSHFINLAVNPSLMIGVDRELRIVKNYQILNKCKPSLFGYPLATKVEENKNIEKTPTAILSTHSRVNAKKKKIGTSSSIHNTDTDIQLLGDKKESTIKDTTMEIKEVKKEEEPNEEILNNPFRIVNGQTPYLSVIPNQDYQPLNNRRFNGIILLKKVNENAQPLYLEEEILHHAPININNNANSTGYQPIPAHENEAEMPEELDLEEIKKK